jgi:hypothetical protein
VIRGDLAALHDDGTRVGLGDVTCIENDSLDGTTGPGTEPANPDSALPLPGDAFFYLVRIHDGVSNDLPRFQPLLDGARPRFQAIVQALRQAEDQGELPPYMREALDDVLVQLGLMEEG